MDREEKLRAYEAMQSAVETEYDRICAELDGLKRKGKVKTATFQSLFAKKLSYQEILSLYHVYGLSEETCGPGKKQKGACSGKEKG